LMIPDGSSLKALVLRGSAWTIAGHGASVLIRLASSLILTRLLFPEVYGVMSLVWMVLYGLAMFSDVGLGPAIVRDKRGDDPDFLNTAWTVQAIRGAVLWGGSCLLAGPMAAFYGQPDLAHLVPVAGLSVLIGGFGSTAVFTCRRHMDFKRLTLLELSTQIVGFAATALWAYVHPTAWAIVGGTLISNLFSTLASHVFLPGTRNRFRWEPASLSVLIAFGKWIFLGSVFYFFSTQADRMLLGHYLDMGQLGVYSIATILIEAVLAVVFKINYGVVLSAYGKVVQEEPHRLRSVVQRTRLGIDVLLIFPIAALMVLGSWVVGMLYDARYHEAGWMLQILCVRPLMASALMNSETCLVALGHPKYALMQSVCRGIWILVGIPVGWSVMGIRGVVWAVGLSEVLVAAVLWVGLIRHQMFSFASELRSLLFVGLGALVGFGLLRILV
jgi:O-antigen/teichoic acid export membrane protein